MYWLMVTITFLLILAVKMLYSHWTRRESLQNRMQRNEKKIIITCFGILCSKSEVFGGTQKTHMNNSGRFEERGMFWGTRRKMLPGWEEGDKKGSKERGSTGGWSWEALALPPRQCPLKEETPLRENDWRGWGPGQTFKDPWSPTWQRRSRITPLPSHVAQGKQR